MIYIVEGVDGTGKTTLCSELCKLNNLHYMHFSSPTSVEDVQNMYEMYLNILITQDDIVLDRSWISDFVYGNVYRKYPSLTALQRDVLERVCISKELTVIFCMDNATDIADRIRKRGDDAHIVPKIEELQKLYSSYMGELHAKHSGNSAFKFRIHRIGG